MMGFFSPAPYHILSYGILLGTTVFHTFVNGIIAFRALPRPYFASLMAQLFPIYFSMQVALPAVLALTYTSPLNNTNGIGGVGGIGGTSGLAGVLEVSNRWTVLAPLAGAFVCAAGNLAVVGPRTTRVMELRRGQERKDGKKAYDSPPHSAAMVALNKRFSILHGISSLLNLGTLAATVVYGVTLSSRLT